MISDLIKACWWRLPANLLMGISSLVVVPVALLFAKREAERLPSWLSWYDDYKYGINGDEYWSPGHVEDPRAYWSRLKWLMRNNCTTFSHKVLGIKVDDIVHSLWLGDDEVANRPKGKSGVQKMYVILRDGSELTGLYVVYQWGNTGRCFRMYLGFKLKELVEKGSTDREYIEFVFSINPLMGFAR